MSGNFDQPPARTSLLERLGRAAAVYFALFLCVVILGGGALAAIVSWMAVGHHFNLNCILTATYLVIAPLEYQSVRFLGDQLDCGEGLVELALQQWKVRLAVRPLVALWWAAHFMAAVVLANWLGEYYLRAGGGHAGNWVYFASLFVRLAGAIAANYFVLLTAAAIWRDAQLLRVIWSLRLLVDLGVAFVPLPTMKLWW